MPLLINKSARVGCIKITTRASCDKLRPLLITNIYPHADQIVIWEVPRSSKGLLHLFLFPVMNLVHLSNSVMMERVWSVLRKFQCAVNFPNWQPHRQPHTLSSIEKRNTPTIDPIAKTTDQTHKWPSGPLTSLGKPSRSCIGCHLLCWCWSIAILTGGSLVLSAAVVTLLFFGVIFFFWAGHQKIGEKFGSVLSGLDRSTAQLATHLWPAWFFNVARKPISWRVEDSSSQAKASRSEPTSICPRRNSSNAPLTPPKSSRGNLTPSPTWSALAEKDLPKINKFVNNALRRFLGLFVQAITYSISNALICLSFVHQFFISASISSLSL